MRKDPISTDEFEPKNPSHFFADKGSFLKFVDDNDPMDEFTPEKREINWAPIERVDPNTGVTFTAYHPAQIYAPESVNEDAEANIDTSTKETVDTNSEIDLVTNESIDSQDEIIDAADVDLEEESIEIQGDPPVTKKPASRSRTTTPKTPAKRATGRKPSAKAANASAEEKVATKADSEPKSTTAKTGNKKTTTTSNARKSSSKVNPK